MASSAIPETPSVPPPRVGSVLHTVVLLAVILAVSLSTAQSSHTFTARHGRVSTYAFTVFWEWALCAYVLWGARRRGVGLRELVGGSWQHLDDALLDVALAAGFWIVSAIVLAGLGYLLGLAQQTSLESARKSLGFLLPHTNPELLLWLALSATAGFCEEIIFRGYLQRQFASFTRNAVAGLVLSALVFGLAHGYEGGRRMALIAVYGALFGLMARWRRSLRPGMMAHAWHDGFTGAVWRLLNI